MTFLKRKKYNSDNAEGIQLAKSQGGVMSRMIIEIESEDGTTIDELVAAAALTKMILGLVDPGSIPAEPKRIPVPFGQGQLFLSWTFEA